MSNSHGPVLFVVPGDLHLTEPGFDNHRVAIRMIEDLALAYREPGGEGPTVLVTHPREVLLATGPRHVIKGADEFRVRTWSRSPVERVQGRIDAGGWFPLDPIGAGDWSAGLPDARPWITRTAFC